MNGKVLLNVNECFLLHPNKFLIPSIAYNTNASMSDFRQMFSHKNKFSFLFSPRFLVLLCKILSIHCCIYIEENFSLRKIHSSDVLYVSHIYSVKQQFILNWVKFFVSGWEFTAYTMCVPTKKVLFMQPHCFMFELFGTLFCLSGLMLYF